MNKTIIIGAGPAGVSAALYLKRANKDVIVIYKDGGTLMGVHQIDNYYGAKKIEGPKLFEEGINQLKELDIPLFNEEVVSIEFDNPYKVVTTKNEYQCENIILATGAHRNTPPIKNISEFEGKGVSYCATCDGFFFRGRKLAILGNDNYAAHEAEYLSNITDDLIVLTNGLELKSDSLNKFKVNTSKIKELKGSLFLEGAILEDNSEIDFDGLFIALGSASSVDFAKHLGMNIESNKIVVDENFMSNIPNIYACGDNVKGLAQVSKAVYEGAAAATAIISKK